MYPLLTINLGHLRENVRTMKRLCGEHGIRITGITKCFTGDPEIARIYLEEGLEILGDSRVDNLERLAGLKAEKWLIRPPMLSEIGRLVRFADVSLNSEISVIRAISEEAVRQGRKHKVVLMADLGDIREGYIDYEELKRTAVEVEKLPNVEVGGVGVNLTCFSFIQHDTEKLLKLTSIADDVSEAIGRKVEYVSGGNSAALDLMLRGGIPEGVNNLRLGESLLFGKERARYQ